MYNAKTVDFIKNLLIDTFNLPVSIEQIAINTNLIELGITSISFVRLIVPIENEFGFEFNDEDLDPSKFPTLESLISYVETHKKEI